MNKGEIPDEVGYRFPMPGEKGGTDYQTFTVRYSGKTYHLATEFKHTTTVRTTTVNHRRVQTFKNAVTVVVP